jgi:hypothetical protein
MAKTRAANGETASAPARDRLRAALKRAKIVREILRHHASEKRPPVTLPTVRRNGPACSR